MVFRGNGGGIKAISFVVCRPVRARVGGESGGGVGGGGLVTDEGTELIVTPAITAAQDLVDEGEDLVDLRRLLLPRILLLLELVQPLHPVQGAHSLSK